MNIINGEKSGNMVGKMTLNYLLNDVKSQTAFVGKLGEHAPNELYLISHERIISMQCPKHAWNDPDAIIYVDRFVDLDITIAEQD